MLKKIFTGWIIFFLLTLSGCISVPFPDTSFLAKQGTIDLSNWNPAQKPYLELKGEWHFVWNQLVTPLKSVDNFKIINVPGEWNQQGYPAFGYATYHLRIKLPKNQSIPLVLQLPNVATAYNLWINEKLIRTRGKVTTSSKGNQTSYASSFIKIPDDLLNNTNELNLTLQVSNYVHFRGGIYNPVYFGGYYAILKRNIKLREFELFSIGAMLFMVFYMLTLFVFLRKRAYETLYLAVIGFIIIIRNLVVNVSTQYWLDLFPRSNFQTMIKIEIISIYLLPLVTILFFDSAFPDHKWKKFVSIARIWGLLLIASSFLFIWTYAYSLPLFYLAVLVTFVFQMYVVIVAIKQNKWEARVTMAGIILAILFTTLESFPQLGWFYVPFPNLSGFSILVFLISQSFVISIRFAKSFFQVEKMFLTTEKEVRIRAEELVHKNKELEEVQEGIIASIRYAQRIQEAILPENTEIKQYLKDTFIFYQPRDIVSGDFYWFMPKDQCIYLAVADCTGHGVPGALMSMLGATNLKYIIGTASYNIAPHTVLELLDKEINYSLKPGDKLNYDGIVLGLCLIDPIQQKLIFSGAKRPLWHFRNKKLSEYQTSSALIGGRVDTKEFRSVEIEIQPNDIVYLFTDGFVDQFGGGAKKKKYSLRRFREFITQIHTYPMNRQKRLIEQEFLEWKGDDFQIDDILIMGIKF